MLQNARVTAFTIVSELLRENQEGGLKLPPTQIRVNCWSITSDWELATINYWLPTSD